MKRFDILPTLAMVLYIAVFVACGIAYARAINNPEPDHVRFVEATFYEAHDRGDGIYDVTIIVPENPDDDYSSEIYVGFYDDDPMWGLWNEIYGNGNGSKTVDCWINYNGEYEVINAFYHDIPVEWR